MPDLLFVIEHIACEHGYWKIKSGLAIASPLVFLISPWDFAQNYYVQFLTARSASRTETLISRTPITNVQPPSGLT